MTMKSCRARSCQTVFRLRRKEAVFGCVVAAAGLVRSMSLPFDVGVSALTHYGCTSSLERGRSYYNLALTHSPSPASGRREQDEDISCCSDPSNEPQQQEQHDRADEGDEDRAGQPSERCAPTQLVE